jgi:[ribosomal protein S5]-alanine N-acetyltransferase
MDFPSELRGEQVGLRPFEIGDITARYLGWLNDPQVVRFSNQRFVRHDQDSSRKYLQSFTGSDNLFLCMYRLDGGEAIGSMTAYVARHHGTVDVGILIGERSVWGRGYGQDAWNLLVGWLLHRPEIRKVTAGTVACNGPMLKLMERSGMRLEGARKAQEIIESQPQDVLYYARFRDV